VDIEALIFTD